LRGCRKLLASNPDIWFNISFYFSSPAAFCVLPAIARFAPPLNPTILLSRRVYLM